jgi:hypothetical protein
MGGVADELLVKRGEFAVPPDAKLEDLIAAA